MRTSISDDSARRVGSAAAAALRRFIEREAKAAGFDQVAVTSPDATPLAAARLSDFVAQGFHGTMNWIEQTLARRGDPRTLWPEVRSIIVVAMNYGPAHDPLAVLNRKDRAAISVYAQNRDYHDIIKGKLKGVAGKLAAKEGCDVKVFVDTAPVMEKPLAQAAGIGWQGKHTNLVSREHGSWLFLGSIFTTADLAPDAAETDHCGSCRACLDACPTDAFPAPYRLDARRCISYLTIESRLPIPHEFREAIGNRIYGCDDCLAACPWNKFARAASEAETEGARRICASPGWPTCWGWTMPAFAACSPARRSSASAATGSCETCSSRPAIRATRPWPVAVGRCSTMLRRWCAARPSGRSADCSRPNLSGT